MNQRRESGASGKVAAVTGGAQGIGRALASALGEAGYAVAIGDRDVASAQKTAAELSCLAIELDVTDLQQMRSFVAEVESSLGPIDVFVNNAGIMTVGPFLEQDLEVVSRQFAVNVFGVINGMQAALPGMLAQRKGRVVNVASAAARVGVPGESTYAATKHAVLGLSEAVRAELTGTGVHIQVVIPGIVATELAAGTRPGRGMRWLRPEEVAAAVVNALAGKRFEIYVPRSLAFPLNLAAALPRPLRDALARAYATDRVATRPDWSRRQSYEAAIAAQSRERE